MKDLLLIRHAEAEKNVEDRHGGRGSDLTEVGKLQCVKLCRRLVHDISDFGLARLLAHNIPQVIESAEVIGAELDVKVAIDTRLNGISLGALAGLSREEALIRFPEAAKRLEEWRNGSRRINALGIPGAEDIEAFRSRVQAALHDMLTTAEQQPVVVVLTRSTLIMITNLVRMSGKFSYGMYRPYDFSPVGITSIGGNVQMPKIDYQNDTSHLFDGYS